ncbi:MAG TPA: DUF4157 domain-containing protein [Candidatus Tenderia sp.]|nr:DUF4157 domain-containing protein [Candidatus Tenderia sp.]
MHSLAKRNPHATSSGQVRTTRSQRKPSTPNAVPAYLQRQTKTATLEERDVERESEAHKLTSVAQLKVRVGPGNDHYEKQADAVAARVIQGSTTPMAITPLGGRLQRKPEAQPGSTQAGSSTVQALNNKGPGEPLLPAIRRRIEPVVGTSLNHVRVHRDSKANRTADQLNARAFTHGRDIWLGSGEQPNNLGLMAHEATHVVQQNSDATQAQRKCDGCEEEATVQRLPSLGDITDAAGAAWDATGGAAIDAAGNAIDAVADWGADQFWALVRRIAPSFEPVLREIADKGIFQFLYDKLKQGVTNLFTSFGVAPETIDAIFGVFENMAGRVAEILVALANGNCDPLFAALDTLKNTLSEMAGSAWSAITDFFTPVGDFFSGLWNSYGAPVMDWLADVAGDLWTELQNLGATIWSWTQPIRDWGSAAWDWVKGQLGMNNSDSGGGEGGITGWISDKIGDAWNSIKETLAPVIEPVQQVAARIGELLPLEAISNLREQVVNWSDQVGNMAQSMNQPNGVAEEQTSLRETILPAVMAAIVNLRTRLVEAGTWVGGKISSLATSVTGFIANLRATPLVSIAANALRWIETKVNDLSVWAQESVVSLFNLVGDGLVRLSRFIEPVLNVLRQIVDVIGNLAGRLPDLIMGPLWWILPTCIREPIKNFLLNQILARIPIFSQLMAIPEAWAQIQATALRILRQVFVDGNLAQAAWTFFSAILRIFNIPPELVTSILANAAAAVGNILRNPVSFLINLLRAVKEGFSRFFNNFTRHMIGGLSGWLFGHLSNAGITPPASFDLQGILGVVLQILDITRERIFQRLARQIGQAATDRLRRALDMATGVWEWVATLVREGPGGLWRVLQERLSNMWDTVVNGIVSWLSTNIITRVTEKLLTMLDPSGVMAVVNSFIAIYRAIQSFIAYLRQMLEIVNSIMQGIAGIARGAISQAASFLERAMARAIPVAIGFLANQLGLGNLGRRIREMVEGVRARVDQAIDWVISRALRMGRAVLDMIRRGASAVGRGARRLRDWWRGEKRFTAGNGENHRIYIQGQGRNARLMIASEPKTYTQFINGLTVTGELASQKQQALAKAGELDQAIATAATTPEGTTGTAVAPATDHAAIITRLMDELATLTAPIMPSDPSTTPLTGAVNDPRVNRTRNYQTRNLGGSEVATSMEVQYLQPGPTVASDSTSGKQPELMGKLVTDPRQQARSKYIRGHLLSRRLGGPANSTNLFPITAQANSNHFHQVENTVIGWSKRIWTYYRVQVAINEIKLDDDNPANNYVNASFICTANKIAMDHSRMTGPDNAIRANIVSRFVPPTGDVRQGGSGTVYRLNQGIVSAISAALHTRDWNNISSALQRVGLGSSSMNIIRRAYNNAMGANVDMGEELGSADKRILTLVNKRTEEIKVALATS